VEGASGSGADRRRERRSWSRAASTSIGWEIIEVARPTSVAVSSTRCSACPAPIELALRVGQHLDTAVAQPEPPGLAVVQ
jgi:hypothetical protein